MPDHPLRTYVQWTCFDLRTTLIHHTACVTGWWTLDSRVLAVHCVPRHQNEGVLLSLSQQAHYMWVRFGLQLDGLTASVGREGV